MYIFTVLTDSLAWIARTDKFLTYFYFIVELVGNAEGLENFKHLTATCNINLAMALQIENQRDFWIL